MTQWEPYWGNSQGTPDNPHAPCPDSPKGANFSNSFGSFGYSGKNGEFQTHLPNSDFENVQENVDIKRMLCHRAIPVPLWEPLGGGGAGDVLIV